MTSPATNVTAAPRTRRTRPTSAPLKDGGRVDRNIFARVAKDGRVTAFQVKLAVRGGKTIVERFENLSEARSYRDSLRADLALDPYKERVLRAREDVERKSRMAGVLVGDLLTAYKTKGMLLRRDPARRYMVDRLAACAVSKVPALALAERDIKRLLETVEAWGVKPTTANKYLSLLSAVLKWAREELDYPLPNPILDLPTKMRRTSAGKPRERRLCPSGVEEAYLRRALGVVKHDETLPLFDLALETAARQGELLRLRWEDVRLDLALALVRDTKNGGDRELLLSPRAIEVLAALRQRQVQLIDGRVFRMTKPNLVRIWTAAKLRAKQAYMGDCLRQGAKPDSKKFVDLRWHDLRREAISTVAESGVLPGLHQLQTFSGHKDSRALEVYVSVSNQQRLAGLLASIPRRVAVKSTQS